MKDMKNMKWLQGLFHNYVFPFLSIDIHSILEIMCIYM